MVARKSKINAKELDWQIICCEINFEVENMIKASTFSPRDQILFLELVLLLYPLTTLNENLKILKILKNSKDECNKTELLKRLWPMQIN